MYTRYERKARARSVRGKRSASAGWNISLDVTCPYCDEYQDIMSAWHEIDGWEVVQVGESKVLSCAVDDPEFQVECELCGKLFMIKDTSY